MKASRKTAVTLGTFVLVCCIYSNIEIFKAVWDTYTPMPKIAKNVRAFFNLTLSTAKASSPGTLIRGSADAHFDSNFIPSLNLFAAENANTFSRVLKLNVENDGNACSGRRFLIYTCTTGNSKCGGWGDRLKGITSTFLFALLSNRTFLIDLSKPCEIGTLVRPNIYDWQKCLTIARTLQSGAVINWKTIDEIDKMLFGKFNNSSVVRVTTNKLGIHKLRNHTLASQVIPWIHTLSEADIIGSIIGLMFRPSPDLSNKLIKFSSVKLKGRRLVCSHIRTGKNPTIPADGRLPKGAPNVTRVLDFLRQYDHYPNTAIFVATDSMDIRKRSRLLFSNFISTEDNIMHVDLYGSARGNKTKLCDGVSAAMLDQLILSRCDVLVLTRSNFGAMAAYMRGESSGLFLSINGINEIKGVKVYEIQTIYKFI